MNLFSLPDIRTLKESLIQKKYLETIKADGYATSSTYVTNNMKLVEQYNLTKYDKGVTNMSDRQKPVNWLAQYVESKRRKC